MRSLTRFFLCSLAGIVLAFGGAPSSQAGVFNIPHFVEPGDFGIGLEPQLYLSNGAGFGGEARYTHGIAGMLNAYGLIGMGSGPRRFRVGGGVVLDIIPDIENQPGIGVAFQGAFAQLKKDSTVPNQVEVTAIPYIHKTFQSGRGEFDPFVSAPFGLGFYNGTYRWLVTAVVGSRFKGNEHLSYTMELGVAINHTESYFSAGLTFYP